MKALLLALTVIWLPSAFADSKGITISKPVPLVMQIIQLPLNMDTCPLVPKTDFSTSSDGVVRCAFSYRTIGGSAASGHIVGTLATDNSPYQVHLSKSGSIPDGIVLAITMKDGREEQIRDALDKGLVTARLVYNGLAVKVVNGN